VVAALATLGTVASGTVAFISKEAPRKFFSLGAFSAFRIIALVLGGYILVQWRAHLERVEAGVLRELDARAPSAPIEALLELRATLIAAAAPAASMLENLVRSQQEDPMRRWVFALVKTKILPPWYEAYRTLRQLLASEKRMHLSDLQDLTGAFSDAIDSYYSVVDSLSNAGPALNGEDFWSLPGARDLVENHNILIRRLRKLPIAYLSPLRAKADDLGALRLIA
jgi:hypothetical protein